MGRDRVHLSLSLSRVKQRRFERLRPGTGGRGTNTRFLSSLVPSSLSEVPFLEHLKHQHPPKWFWQKSRFLFPLGLLLGGVLAFVLVSPIE